MGLWDQGTRKRWALMARHERRGEETWKIREG
jgi:hypothetical protein